MKKLWKVAAALLVVVVLGTGLVLSTGAAARRPVGTGHHGRGYHRHATAEERQQYFEEREAYRKERAALREERVKEFEEYVDQLVKDGKLTKEEGKAYKASPQRLAEYCYDKGYTQDRPGYGTGIQQGGEGRGPGRCHRWNT